MTALDDFVMGASPQPDPLVCAEHRIGYDRVWRVGAVLLAHAGEDSRCFPSRDTLADLTGIHPRTVRTALLVLERSGVIRRFGSTVHLEADYPSAVWVPAWEASTFGPDDQIVAITGLTVDPERCRKERIGQDRTWRVGLLYRAGITAADALSAVMNIGIRQVRSALSALGLGGDVEPQAPASQTPAPQEDPTVPYAMFEDDDSRVPDESDVPTKVLRRARSMAGTPCAGKKKTPRHGRPLETWSAFDMAVEAQWMLRQAHPTAPGDTGDARKISIILAKMRKQHGHDARVEMYVLDRFLNDWDSIYSRNPHVALWRKWIASFKEFYSDAENQVAYEDPEYVHYRRRFEKSAKPDPTLTPEDLAANRSEVEKLQGKQSLEEIIAAQNAKMRRDLGR